MQGKFVEIEHSRATVIGDDFDIYPLFQYWNRKESEKDEPKVRTS